MRKQKIPMILLFLMGLLIIGACEKFEDPDLKEDQFLETLEDSALEEDQSLETHEDADKIKKESDPSA